ncbi:MAG: redoxin domain-containing protein [Elusimicrobiota bacterium]|nr:redoxin domain-containing protein [Elusimicrobiota bacterium]
MKKFFFIVWVLALAACSGEPLERPKLAKKGLPAPEISLKKLIGAPATELKGWEELKGKVVVLEFWATWCEPCVDAIPMLNRLAERFRNQPVVFIHVTDESEADVLEFMKTRRIDGWVAPETGAEVFKAFRVYGRPHTVVIDKAGAVASFPAAGGLNPESLMGLLAGQPGPESPAAVSSTAPALAEFYLSKAAAQGGTAQYGPASLNASAMPLEYALEWLYGRIDRFDIQPEAGPAMAAYYNIRLRLPPEREAQKKEFFLKGLESALGLKVKKTEREAEVYVLKKAPGGMLNVKERRDYGGTEIIGTVLQVKGGSFAAVASRLKEVFRQPVLDETGAAGPFEYDLELDSSDPKAIDLQLRKQLGLKLQRLRRKITVVEISKIK